MSRTILRAAIAALIVVAAWSALWLYVARQAEPRIAAWAATQRADGLAAEYGPVEVTGYPMSWRVGVAAPRMAGAGPTGWEWHGERVEISMTPWRVREAALSFPGLHRLTAGAGAARRTIELRAARPEGRIDLGAEGKLARLILDLAELEVREPPVEGTSRIKRARIELAPRREAPADHRADALESKIRLEEIVLARPPANGLGERLSKVELDTSFKGRLPAGPLAESVARWRDEGGTIEVIRLALDWGPLDLDGNGTLALDERNRPLGAFTTRIRGYSETVDALARAGMLRPREAANLKVALNLFARQQGDGGPKELVVPLTAQDGRLAVAGFNLLRLEPLRFE